MKYGTPNDGFLEYLLEYADTMAKDIKEEQEIDEASALETRLFSLEYDRLQAEANLHTINAAIASAQAQLLNTGE